jgi:hypothetical protein
MNKFKYEEPFFKAVDVQSEDVITTSIASTFGFSNGFESDTSTASSSSGEWNMPEFTL